MTYATKNIQATPKAIAANWKTKKGRINNPSQHVKVKQRTQARGGRDLLGRGKTTGNKTGVALTSRNACLALLLSSRSLESDVG